MLHIKILQIIFDPADVVTILSFQKYYDNLLTLLTESVTAFHVVRIGIATNHFKNRQQLTFKIYLFNLF